MTWDAGHDLYETDIQPKETCELDHADEAASTRQHELLYRPHRSEDSVYLPLKDLDHAIDVACLICLICPVCAAFAGARWCTVARTKKNGILLAQACITIEELFL